MKIHHIGYLVKDINQAIENFKKLGFHTEEYNSESIIKDDLRGIYITFMLNETYRIELVQPVDKESPIYGLLKKYKNSPYHICYHSSNLNEDIKKMEQDGWTLFQDPQPAIAIDNHHVAFLMNVSIGMIELVEK